MDSRTIESRLCDLEDITKAHSALLDGKFRDWRDVSNRDNSSQVQALCLSCNHSCKVWGGPELTECGAFDSCESIVQALEDGLFKAGNGLWYTEGPPYDKGPCTRIYLPEAKYEEFIHSKWDGGKNGVGFHIHELKTTWLFHDIPVYCGGPDIKYCTD